MPVDDTRELSAEDIAAEFGIPLAATAVPVASAPVVEEFSVDPVLVEEPEPQISAEAPPALAVEPQSAAAGEELDLSDEWEAISQDVEKAEQGTLEDVPLAAETQSEAVPVEAEAVPELAESEAEPVFVLDDSDATPLVEQPAAETEADAQPTREITMEAETVPGSTNEFALQPDVFEIQESSEEAEEKPAKEIVEEPAFELLPAEPAAASGGEFELELAAEPIVAGKQEDPATTEDFLSELAAEVEDLEIPAADSILASPEDTKEPLPYTVSELDPRPGKNGERKFQEVGGSNFEQQRFKRTAGDNRGKLERAGGSFPGIPR